MMHLLPVTKHLKVQVYAVTKQVYGRGTCLVTVLWIRVRRLVTAIFSHFRLTSGRRIPFHMKWSSRLPELSKVFQKCRFRVFARNLKPSCNAPEMACAREGFRKASG